ncbi:hypothetical protein ACLB2K_042399 [Fragaria x ananassa]
MCYVYPVLFVQLVIQYLLSASDLFCYFDATYPCPPRYALSEEGSVTSEVTTAYKQWKMVDKALLSLLMATLDDEIMDIIVGSKSSREAWLAIQERFSSVSGASIMQLKTDLQTIKKGSDSVDKYLLCVKHARDQLNSVGVSMLDEDVIVITLNGLPDEYAMIKTVIRAKDTSISFKDLRAQLLTAERDIEVQFSIPNSLTAMAARGTSHNGNYRASCNFSSRDEGKGVWIGNGDKQQTWSNSKFSQGSSSQSGGFQSKGALECQECGKQGHLANDCYSNLECGYCHRKGHIASICYNNPASPNFRSSSTDANENSISTNETSDNSDNSANNSDSHTNISNTHFWSNNGLQSNVTGASLVDGTEVINGGDNPSSLPYELSFVEDPNQAYNNHSMLTRAKNGIIKKKSFEDYCAFSCIVQQENFDELAFFSGFSSVMHLSDLIEPCSFKSATGKPEWDDAMNEEISALKKQSTWELVPLPQNKNIVVSKWIYKIKKNLDGSVSRFKARLVAQGGIAKRKVWIMKKLSAL